MKKEFEIAILKLKIKYCEFALAFWDRVLVANHAIMDALSRIGA